MCKKLNEILIEKRPILIGALMIVIFILSFLLISGKPYDINVKVGDKQITVAHKDLGIAFSEFGKTTREIVLIESSIRIEEQKTCLDDIAVSIMRENIDRHVELLKTKGIIKDVYSNNQYKNYVHITKICLEALKVMAINDFKKMNIMFTQKSEKEFKEFAKNCIVKYISEYGDMVKREWIDLGIVSSDENYEWTRQIVPSIAAKIMQIMDKAFDVQVKYENRIAELNSSTVTIQSDYK